VVRVSVRHALLGLLSGGPKYGMQLRQEFEAGTGEVWPLNVGQVYSTLQRLDRDGLVSSDLGGDQGPQQMYRITEDGLVELQAWLRTPPEASAPPRDELVIKVLVALRVADANVAEVVQVHRRHMVELMQQYTRLKEELTDVEVTLGIVVDAELFRLDGLIRWLDAADGRVKRHGSLPLIQSAAEAAEESAPERLRRKIGVRR
jgi:DNA-binding PadR family transcriptional regulator